MDIVERLRNVERYQDAWNICDEASDEIERLRKQSRINWVAFQKAADEIKRLREALQKIAAVDDEKLPTPATQAEGVLWSTLDACVGLARKALGEKE